MSRHWVLAPLLIVASIAVAQSDGLNGDSSQANPQPEEKTLGSFVVHQSVEFGYRQTEVNGETLGANRFLTGVPSPGPADQAMYDTLVNLHTGPRLFGQTLSLQAPDHNGLAFDDLYLTSFGFGGDPNDVARARISKYKWYDFNGLFRRDWNFWNYDLLANPLNPSTSNPAILVTDSPHWWNTSRRMLDLSLTLAQQSPISLRTGYSRNTADGLSSGSIPEGTVGPGTTVESIEMDLAQHNNVVSEQYQAGIDFKVLPRTTISYDQFVMHTRNDNHWRLHNFPFVLPDGSPANLGISWNTTSPTSPSPCPVPFPSGLPVADPTCSLYLSYNRSDHMRTHMPTEQLSFQSQYFRKVDLSARASYSNATLTGPFFEFFNGFLPDCLFPTLNSKGVNCTRQSNTTGPMVGERINVSTDFNATVHVTKHLSVSDQFRFYSFRSPAFWNSFTSIWTGPQYFSAINPAGNPLTTPADFVDNTFVLSFIGQNTKSNELQIHYDLPRGGAMIGYRYDHTLYRVSEINEDFGDPSNPTIPPAIGTNDFGGATNVGSDFGQDFVEVNSHSALAGIWIRPTNHLRVTANVELTTADNFLTRIMPRRLLHYTVRSRYQPTRWIQVAAHADVWERRNGVSDIDYNAHNRNFGVTATVSRSDRLAWEGAYNYNNVGSNAFICYQTAAAFTAIAAGTLSPEGPCNANAPLNLYETYSDRDHFASTTVMVKPIKRMTTRIGYSIVSSNGGGTILNPLQPLGSLKSRYHQPIAELQLEFVKNWSAIGRWNYYDYHEATAFFGPTAPRDFHANVGTVSLRYAF